MGIAPRFRGKWGTVANEEHRNRFSPSGAYGAHGFQALGPQTESGTGATVHTRARTTVDENGYTAVRVNLPPVGFNKARINIEIDGHPALAILDLEVPAVVVIDPGHGGEKDLPGSDANHATSPSGVKEKDLTLSYGLALRDALRTQAAQGDLNARIFMTRDEDKNKSGTFRAHFARDRGADVHFIIHFNASDGPTHSARGTLEVRQIPSQVNLNEDVALIDPIIDSVVAAIRMYDSGGNKRDFVAIDTSTAFDPKLGNTTTYHPIRAGYIEVEFLDNADVDELLNTGSDSSKVKASIVQAMSNGIIRNLKLYPQSQ